LIDTGIRVGVYKRHQFIVIDKEFCQLRNVNISSLQQKRLTEKVVGLMELDKLEYPSRRQWSTFYHQLGRRTAPKQNVRVEHDEIKSKVLSYWGEPFLNSLGLADSLTEYHWITRLFQRHKASFSFLQHLIVLDALLDNWSWEEVFNDAVNMKILRGTAKTEKQIVDEVRREKWIAAIKKFGIQGAIEIGFAAERTWLYRHDRKWYLATNAKYRLSMARENKRVDWQERDQRMCEALQSELKKFNLVKLPHRITKTWLISQMDKKSTIESKLAKMPETSKLINSLAESVSDYQMRRVRNTVEDLERDNVPITEWRILRIAGLNDQRLRPKTSQLIQQEVIRKGDPDSLVHCKCVD
tara:strand:- start:1323 stop:2387 length:1065 start_codon:yes stop_codon:yes gene_type:complete